jgi:O-methyltransferase involved in polyketide biosynthesis
VTSGWPRTSRAKPGVRWFEDDRVATLADKQQRLARLGLAAPHVSFLGHDLTQPGLSARLVDAG